MIARCSAGRRPCARRRARTEPSAVADHPAVAGRVGDDAGEQRDGGAAAGVRGDAGRQGRRLAAAGRRRARTSTRAVGRRPAGRRARSGRRARCRAAAPGRRPRRRGDLGQVRGDLVAPVPDDDDGLRRRRRGAAAARTCPSSERPAKPCRTFGRRARLHPGAFARGEDDRRRRAGRRRSPVHPARGARAGAVRCRPGACLAGGLGLEPRLSGTKDRRAANYPIPH